MAKKNPEKQEFTLEEGFRQMEGILEALEQDDVTLEEAFQNYQKGMTVLKACAGQIDKVEKKVLKLSTDASTGEPWEPAGLE
jgi:exodeoxyribonuclease VII small subunit